MCIKYLMYTYIQDEQVHEAYEYNKLHRGRGEPFLTEFQKEDEALVQHLEDQKVECVCACMRGLSLSLSLVFSLSLVLSLSPFLLLSPP